MKVHSVAVHQGDALLRAPFLRPEGVSVLHSFHHPSSLLISTDNIHFHLNNGCPLSTTCIFTNTTGAADKAQSAKGEKPFRRYGLKCRRRNVPRAVLMARGRRGFGMCVWTNFRGPHRPINKRNIHQRISCCNPANFVAAGAASVCTCMAT